jgi:Kdo2-lipid IVA lauroyltransferase/acyltransferase
MRSSTNTNAAYYPRYWPLWLVIGLLWLLVQLPYRWQLTIGKTIGLIVMRFAKRERHIAHINLEKCFPQLSENERATLFRNSFISMGMGVIETAFGWWASNKRLAKLAHFEGEEHFREALKQNRGILICTPHFSPLYIASRLVNIHHSFSGMFFPPKNPVFRKITLKSMQRYFQQAIPRDDARMLIKALKNKAAVLYTPDTDAGLKNSIFAPFFGIQTATVTATARFAQISGCAVMFASYWRREDGKGYGLRYYPALENFPSDCPLKDATRINQLIEQAILEHPEQYLWQYKRFKTRPPGEAKFY